MSKLITINQANKKYDTLYKLAQYYLKQYNPCKISSKGCVGSSNFCCTGCSHLTNKGCSIDALTCRTWLCSFSHYPITHGSKRLKLLSKLTHLYGFYGFRFSKEQSINQSIAFNKLTN